MKKGNSKLTLVILAILGLMLLASGLSSSNRSSKSYSTGPQYSRQYQTDSSYRQAVDYGAKTFGISSQEADSVIQRLAEEANR